MRLSEFISYSYEDLNTFTVILTEAESDWEIQISTAYKKGFKRHENDRSVINPLYRLKDFILSHETIPKFDTYPSELNVHKLTGPFKGYYDAHLKGQKIIVVFGLIAGEKNLKADPKNPATKWKSKNILRLVHVGTHQELGWGG